MRFHVSILLAILGACLFVAGPAASAPADDSVRVTPDALKQMGVNKKLLVISQVSDDGTLVVGSERSTDARDIAQHHIYKLHFFKTDWTRRTVTHDSMWVPLMAPATTALCSDGKSLISVGNEGTRVVAVDLPSKAAHVVFQHAAGKRGFRVDPMILWLEHGTVHARGYFYDGNQMATAPCVASIDPSASGVEAFHKVRDVGALMKKVRFFGSCIWFSSTQAYFSLPVAGRLTDICAYLGDDSNLQYLDRGSRVDAMAVGQDSVVYALRQSDRTSRLTIQDVGLKKTWHPGDGRSNYTYLYMSTDGTTMLTSLIDLVGRKMTTFYAHEAHNFGLKPMPGMVNAFPGVIRMARSGKVLAFFSTRDGIFIRRIPGE